MIGCVRRKRAGIAPKPDPPSLGHRQQLSSPDARRAAHELSGRGVMFRMADEIRGLRSDLEHTSGERAAKTFAKTEDP